MSKTPAEALKENFWIGAKGGLLDAKHILKMGQSVWLFMYLLRNQTALNPAGEGIANYGHPLTFDFIGADLKGIPARTVRKWAARLKLQGYIRAESHGPQGVIFWIAKGKAKTRKVKVTEEETRAMLESRPKRDAIIFESRPIGDAIQPESRPIHAANQDEDISQPLVAVAVAAVSETPTPKGFTSESPSYYNKDAPAKNAGLPIPSFKEVMKDKSPPRTPSQADLDARRRELLRQAERIQREHPDSGKSPGKVVELQPKEATA
jgi:hypothetical protein